MTPLPLSPYEARRAADPLATGLPGRPKLTAYRALGVEPNRVLEGPKCTPFFNDLPGGIPLVLASLRASPLPEARAVMSRYDDPTLSAKYRALLPLEAFCHAANVCPSRLTEVAVAAIAKNRVLRGAVIAALAHPDIMTVNTEQALDPEGVEDRMAHMKMVGAMPAARGASTVVNVNASAHAAAQSLAASATPTTAPPAEDTIRRIVEARQQAAAALIASQQRELPAAPPTLEGAFMPRVTREPATIDADYSDSDSSAGDDE